MPTAPDLRYTDRDVREDPALKPMVLDYLAAYGGEFDPLVRAQNMIEMDGDLTTAMTRTVLNCMRTDGNVAHRLPAPRGYVMSTRPTVQRPAYVRPDEDDRPRRMVWPIRLRFDYVINLHAQARWYHKIDHSSVYGYYYPPGWWNENEEHSIVLHMVRAACGKDLHANRWPRQPHIVLGDKLDADDSGNEYCPRCEHGHRDAGWKP